MRATLDSLDARLGDIRQRSTEDGARLRESLLEKSDGMRLKVIQDLGEQRLELMQQMAALRELISTAMGNHRTSFEACQAQAIQSLQESMRVGFQDLHRQLGDTLQRNATELGLRVDGLTRSTDERLREISGQVEQRLAEGFEKTTATFTDVLQRLALIDEAQKKISALSSDVISLQQILADKRSRGAFGEVQLAALIRNVMPEASFKLQYTFPNGKIADCALFMPPPTGTLAIDAKFPLEAYRRMTDFEANDHERKQAERQFKTDIRKHIQDIAARYIIPNVTADGAMMFIPAEAVFAEIQAHHSELVDEAHAARVWLVSPTTLWAVLNTACAVLKDAATREQVDLIRDHLGLLAKDFQRFRERMDHLARHIEQAHDDVQRVHVSARRISDRFERIERVEFDAPVEKAPEIGSISAPPAN
ncbi:MAG: DNA recombination protein RmuC [Gammaproteobacteria bacterium]|nr:DNA recombination protein RmuC [Gammaproteobacteria bacterium]